MIKFDELSLDAKILENIKNKGYEHPTPIQEQCIPHLLNGSDLLGVAQTGTCLLYTSPSPRDRQKSRMPSSA